MSRSNLKTTIQKRMKICSKFKKLPSSLPKIKKIIFAHLKKLKSIMPQAKKFKKHDF